ncbi:alpha/beta hydrolase [Saccharothrix syringae]|uniref:Alpha/beta hydrolase n=1 Tax=Saccharothrix syringae TaxID=103733 RepID=A0A5Q0GYT6_SACSY|nr:alpha/beta hydrolase [Saccharothrix syringae]QFZ19217.1 alpha/beta hydrolase [Saccharothrix syringae]
MNDVEELKRYVAAHAESLAIPPEDYRAVLDRVTHDGVGPGSWVYEWSRRAEELEAEGELLAAAQRYNFARFPFVDGNARLDALENSVRVTDEWRVTVPGIERLDLPLLGGEVGFWTHGLSTSDPKPLLLISGGIVSTKEQWAPVLLAGARLGFAAVVTELPGVGENTLRYNAESWRLIPAILDALADRADVTRTAALALSFSGHAALRAAVEDRRIRTVATAGAPIRHTFADADWVSGLPKVTADTLAHLVGVPPGALPSVLPTWALSADHLRALDIPVRYVASLRDEIIAPGDLALLREHVRDLDVLAHDDVHGAPRHAARTREWLIDAVRSSVEVPL